MSEVNLVGISRQAVCQPIDVESEVRAKMDQIIAKVEGATRQSDIIQASQEAKAVYKMGLSDGPQNKGFQRRLADIFCAARQEIAGALIGSRFRGRL